MASIQHKEMVLPIPNGWEDRSQAIAVSPTGNDFRANVVVVSEPIKPGEKIEQFAARHVETLKQTFEGFQVVTEGAKKLGAFEGFWREYVFSAAGKKYGQIQYHALAENSIYTFTYSDVADRMAKAKPQVEAMFAQAKLGYARRAGGGGGAPTPASPMSSGSTFDG
ncbi:MAG TPA: DcrB-related protein [Myxococcaceae bacterium]|nr:DcrB-related protein [Myxococcaceae bacterium]